MFRGVKMIKWDEDNFAEIGPFAMMADKEDGICWYQIILNDNQIKFGKAKTIGQAKLKAEVWIWKYLKNLESEIK